ncbi:MAG: 6,7-dimethyl-8-ribityllumazine synthase [Patescibacteria group bacterium]
MKNKKDIRIAIVGSDFQKFVTDNLEKRCVETLVQHGVGRDRITLVRVPGSLEIPLAALLLAEKKKYDAIVAFGAIHKGKTYHFQQVADECIRGCMNVSLEYQIPVIYEVLAVYDIKDAKERATRKKENRGVEAALSALAMVGVVRAVRKKGYE